MRFEPHHDFYRDIGVALKGRPPHTVTEDELKQSYRQLMVRYHPDKVRMLPDAERAKALKIAQAAGLAKEVLLKDPDLRASYHDYLAVTTKPKKSRRTAYADHPQVHEESIFNQSFEELWEDFANYDRVYHREMEKFLRREQAGRHQFHSNEELVNSRAGALMAVFVGLATGMLLFKIARERPLTSSPNPGAAPQ